MHIFLGFGRGVGGVGAGEGPLSSEGCRKLHAGLFLHSSP